MASESVIANPPPGVTLRHMLRGHRAAITRLAWSPAGHALATPALDSTIGVWDIESGQQRGVLAGHQGWVTSVAWSPDSRLVASASFDRTVRTWDALSGAPVRTIAGHPTRVESVAWSRDGALLATGSGDGLVRIFGAHSGGMLLALQGHRAAVTAVAFSPRGRLLASASHDGTVRLWDLASGQGAGLLEGHVDWVNALAWSPDGSRLASGSSDRTLRLWDADYKRVTHIIEGHTSAVAAVAFSGDGRLLASTSGDDQVQLWRTDTFEIVAAIAVGHDGANFWQSLAFHPGQPLLATASDADRVVSLWRLDEGRLLGAARPVPAVHGRTARVVVAGESETGKSTLARRLADDRYDGRTPSPWTRLWTIGPERLGEAGRGPGAERREVALWDLGGRDDAASAAWLMLRETHLALVVFDPTRGPAAADEARTWSARLEKELRGKPLKKILVGTKVDEEGAVVDHDALRALIAECGFAGYYPTSAVTGAGIDRLRDAIGATLDWDVVARSSRPEAFQRIRAVIDRARLGREPVLRASELRARAAEEAGGPVDPRAIDAVIDQLTGQGAVSDVLLGSGERALVLDMGQVERYAAAIIKNALARPDGLPAAEERHLAALEADFSGIAKDERLVRSHERVIVEYAVQRLLERGVCLQHHGMLIFPGLYSAAANAVAADGPAATASFYDTMDASARLYAAIVARYAVTERFGRLRLRAGLAEFQAPGTGTYGLRLAAVRGGLGRLDVLFDDRTTPQQRELFLAYIEEKMRRRRNERVEIDAPTCKCGFAFSLDTVWRRVLEGHDDVACPECDVETPITKRARRQVPRSPALAASIDDLDAVAEKRRKEVVRTAKSYFARPEESRTSTEPLRILHVADLFIRGDTDTSALALPLVADLRDMGASRVDYVVISGDVAFSASPTEYDRALEFLAALLPPLQLSAERVIVVPGNHDVDWRRPVYHCTRSGGEDWGRLAGDFVIDGDLLAIRNGARYPERFASFSRYFYHPLTQHAYPLSSHEQCLPFLYAEAGLQFLAMNSCCSADEFYPHRADIQPDALSRGIELADAQVEAAKRDGRLGAGADVLRIAVWHHPLLADDQLLDRALLEELRYAGVRLCLHGHVHGSPEVFSSPPTGEAIFLAGAGALGEPEKARPEGLPRYYNLVEVARDLTSARVHTRAMTPEGRIWRPWTVWPAGTGRERRAYYDITGLR